MTTSEILIDDKQVKDLLNRLSSLTKNMSPAFREIGETILLSVQDNFKNEGRPSWKKLSDKWTIPARAKKGKWPGKILQVSGKLLRSVNYKVFPDGVIIGTADIRARMLNFGGTTGLGTKIPPRPFMTVQDKDVKDIIKILQDKITEMTK